MNTNIKNRPRRRKALLSAGAVTLAAAALTFGAAAGANAATGHSNQGIRNLQVTPTAPATNFNTTGTTGTVTYNSGDGTPAGSSFSVAVGESTTTAITLPSGLVFATGACSAPTLNWGSPWSTACTVSSDGQTLTAVMTRLIAFSGAPYDNNSGVTSIPVVSTGGLIYGNVSATFTPLPGLGTATPTASGPVVGGATPLGSLSAGTPAADGSIPLSGVATPGATITVKDSTGATVGTATADPSTGEWTVSIPAGVVPPLSITQTVSGVISDPVEFNTAPLPVLNPAVAAGVLALVGAGIGGTVLYRRRKAANTKP